MVSAAAADRAAARGRKGRIVAIDGGWRRHGVVIVTIFGRFVLKRYLQNHAKLTLQDFFLSPTMELELLNRFNTRVLIMRV